MKEYNLIEGEKMSYLEVEGSKGTKYYLTPWINPLFTFIEFNDKHSTTSWKRALPHQILWTCSCMDFQIGKARRGENPFANPCTHIKALLADTKNISKKLEALIYANKGMAQGANEEETKKEKSIKKANKASRILNEKEQKG